MNNDKKSVFNISWRTIIKELKCGWHSGFSLCCILWFILPWNLILRFAKWDDKDHYTWYHKLMNQRQPRMDMLQLDLHGEDMETQYIITDFTPIRIKGWGMVPCPLHLLLRRRNTVLTCFCSEIWMPKVKARAIKEYPELCSIK